MTNKIVVSKPGFNVKTETNVDNLIYSSDYDTLKYYVSGSVTLDGSGGGNAETSVAHNLGYKPFFIVMVDYPTAGGYNICPGAFKVVTDYATANAYTDDNTLYFKWHKNISQGTITFRYFIFKNRLGL